MAKVYVVVEGEYSDYHIVALFSTRELAEEYIKRNRDTEAEKEGKHYFEGHELEIEEHELDPELAPQKVWQNAWTQTINLETGQMGEHANMQYYRGYTSPYKSRVEAGETERALTPEIEDNTQKFWNNAWAKVTSLVSAEHADKLAVETRQAWLRKQTEPAAH